MSLDPLADLRRQRDEALAALDDQTLAGQYERGAIEMAWEKFIGEEQPETRLEVRIVGSRDPSARVTALVQQAIGDAAARIAHSFREPRWEGHSITEADRAQSGLVQRQQVGNLLVFAAPGLSPGADQLDAAATTRGQDALRALVELLPEDAGHDRALETILAERPAVRRAVHSLAEAATVASGLGLRLSANDVETQRSVLTANQARVLEDSLGVVTETTTRESHTGRLDGIRTKRRIFYLELKSGSEIYGAIDQDQLEAVRRNIDKDVTVTLAVSQSATAAGRKGRRHYRLIDLRPADDPLSTDTTRASGA